MRAEVDGDDSEVSRWAEVDRQRAVHLDTEQLEAAMHEAEPADKTLSREDMLEEDVEGVEEGTQDSEQVAVDTPAGHIAAADIRGRPDWVVHIHMVAAGLAAAILAVVQGTAPEAVEVAVDIREAADSAL